MLSVQEKDLLEQDPPIRGQNFACLSFISPEEILKRKEDFYFENYIQHFSAKANELLVGLQSAYPEESDKLRSIHEEFEYIFNPAKIADSYKNFTGTNSGVLDKEFDSKHEFQTSIRGLKIRGVYDSLPEAQARCEKLRKIDSDKFNIFISEVGVWCPWAPNPNDISDQQYALDSLNTLIHEYDKNVEDRNNYYNERKNDLQARLAKNEQTKAENRANIDQEDLVKDDIEEIKHEVFEKPNPVPRRSV